MVTALKMEVLSEARIVEVYQIARAYALKANYGQEVEADFPGYAVTKLIEVGEIHMPTCFINFLRAKYGAKTSSRYHLSKALRSSADLTEVVERGEFCLGIESVEIKALLETVLSGAELAIVTERVILETPLRDIADRFEISSARVSQIVKEALIKVREYL